MRPPSWPSHHRRCLYRIIQQQRTLTSANIAALNAWRDRITGTSPSDPSTSQAAERTYSASLSRSTVRDLLCTLPTTRSLLAPTYDAFPLPRVIPGTHAALALLHPAVPESEPVEEDEDVNEAEAGNNSALAPDGTDRVFSPPPSAGLVRRMWAGGVFRWPDAEDGPGAGREGRDARGALRPWVGAGDFEVGREAIARARVVGVELKGLDAGPSAPESTGASNSAANSTPMALVQQHIVYAHADDVGDAEDVPGAALFEEQRVHVFLPALGPEERARARVPRAVPVPPASSADFRFSWTPSPVTLFRFSALTFNAHSIHLDREFARAEGHPDLLVHGPLTALMLVEAFLHSARYTGRLASFAYRAQNPVLVGQRQHILGQIDEEERSVTVWAEDDEGVVGMTGQIELA